MTRINTIKAYFEAERDGTRALERMHTEIGKQEMTGLTLESHAEFKAADAQFTLSALRCKQALRDMDDDTERELLLYTPLRALDPAGCRTAQSHRTFLSCWPAAKPTPRIPALMRSASSGANGHDAAS